jgi:hypothetical protein
MNWNDDVPCESGTCCVNGDADSVVLSPAGDDMTDHVELNTQQVHQLVEQLKEWLRRYPLPKV